ncbi:hypothetical protein BH09PSE5_BH09PSE5_31750 [soil metagenome]
MSPAAPLPSPASAASADAFERARTLFIDGLTSFEAGRFEEAEACFVQSLQFLPGRISTQVNLAATLLKLGRAAEALVIADEILAIEADNTDALFHRGNALGAMGSYPQALSAYERVCELGAANATIMLFRGQMLQRLNRRDEALDSYDKALQFDDELALAWSSRGGILREMKRHEEAAHAFRQAIANGADDELNRYYLASVDKQALPPAAPGFYVEALFDDYADQFDEHLVGVLGYQAHAVLVRQLQVLVAAEDGASAASRPARFAATLDLGCGTGLCGKLVKPLTDRLVGVDLSSQMMERAKALGVYDQLVHEDIAAFLHATGESFDLIVAADVFIYTGDLAPLFEGARKVMGGTNAETRPRMFCFSVEQSPDEDSDFVLLPSLRYAHTERYIRALASQYRFRVAALTREPIRKDQRESIPGLFVYLTPA